jgi:DIL domain
MSFFRHMGKKSCKLHYSITIHSAEYLPLHNTEAFHVELARGKKTHLTRVSMSEENSVLWDDVIEFDSTMYLRNNANLAQRTAGSTSTSSPRSRLTALGSSTSDMKQLSALFEPKEYVVKLKAAEQHTIKKGNSLGRKKASRVMFYCTLNLSRFVSLGTDTWSRVLPLFSQAIDLNSVDDRPALKVTIQCKCIRKPAALEHLASDNDFGYQRSRTDAGRDLYQHDETSHAAAKAATHMAQHRSRSSSAISASSIISSDGDFSHSGQVSPSAEIRSASRRNSAVASIPFDFEFNAGALSPPAKARHVQPAVGVPGAAPDSSFAAQHATVDASDQASANTSADGTDTGGSAALAASTSAASHTATSEQTAHDNRHHHHHQQQQQQQHHHQHHHRHRHHHEHDGNSESDSEPDSPALIKSPNSHVVEKPPSANPRSLMSFAAVEAAEARQETALHHLSHPRRRSVTSIVRDELNLGSRRDSVVLPSFSAVSSLVSTADTSLDAESSYEAATTATTATTAASGTSITDTQNGDAGGSDTTLSFASKYAGTDSPEALSFAVASSFVQVEPVSLQQRLRNRSGSRKRRSKPTNEDEIQRVLNQVNALENDSAPSSPAADRNVSGGRNHVHSGIATASSVSSRSRNAAGNSDTHTARSRYGLDDSVEDFRAIASSDGTSSNSRVPHHLPLDLQNQLKTFEFSKSHDQPNPSGLYRQHSDDSLCDSADESMQYSSSSHATISPRDSRRSGRDARSVSRRRTDPPRITVADILTPLTSPHGSPRPSISSRSPRRAASMSPRLGQQLLSVFDSGTDNAMQQNMDHSGSTSPRIKTTLTPRTPHSRRGSAASTPPTPVLAATAYHSPTPSPRGSVASSVMSFASSVDGSADSPWRRRSSRRFSGPNMHKRSASEAPSPLPHRPPHAAKSSPVSATSPRSKRRHSLPVAELLANKYELSPYSPRTPRSPGSARRSAVALPLRRQLSDIKQSPSSETNQASDNGDAAAAAAASVATENGNDTTSTNTNTNTTTTTTTTTAAAAAATTNTTDTNANVKSEPSAVPSAVLPEDKCIPAPITHLPHESTVKYFTLHVITKPVADGKLNTSNFELFWNHIPVAACVTIRCLLGWGAYHHSHSRWALDRITEAITAATLRCTSVLDTQLYLLSVVVYLIHFHKRLKEVAVRNMWSDVDTESVEYALTELIDAQSRLSRSVDRTWMQRVQRVPINPLVDPEQIMEVENESITQLLQTYAGIFNDLKASSVPVIVRNAFLSRAFVHLDCSMSNAILQQSHFCASHTGIRVQMTLSTVEAWCFDLGGNELRAAFQANVVHIRQLSQLLLTSKGTFTSLDDVKALVPDITITQLDHILNSYSQQPACADPPSNDLLLEVSRSASQPDAMNQALLLDPFQAPQFKFQDITFGSFNLSLVTLPDPLLQVDDFEFLLPRKQRERAGSATTTSSATTTAVQDTAQSADNFGDDSDDSDDDWDPMDDLVL